MKIFAIANIFNTSGVYVHIINVLRELVKLGHEVTVYVPYQLVENNTKVVEEVENNGIKVHYLVKEFMREHQRSEIRTLKYFITSHTNNLGKDSRLINEVNDNYDIIYDMHEDVITLRVSYHLGKKLRVPVAKLMHDEPYRNSFGRGYRKIMGFRGLTYDTLMSIFYKLDKRTYEKVMKEGVLKGLAGVSRVPFYLSNVDKIAEKYNVITEVFKVGNAFNKELIFKYRKTKNKENYAVFFARLVPQKGLYELPKIAEKLNSKLIVFGKIYNISDSKYLNSEKIEYKGYRPIEEVYDTVANAKVLIYPSHQDGYSLVVLDTLALGTSVVAYDIPAMRFVFGNLKPVRLVKEFDTNEMAKTANYVLNMPDEEYENEHENIKGFIDEHSDWRNVALETERFLNKVLEVS